MNAIIITRNGVVETPILIKSDKVANSVYEDIIRKELGEDFDQIGFIDDMTYDKVNRLLNGVSINYFTNI